MLVGIKTNLDEKGDLIWPTWLNRGLDTDVIVSEVRETSRKPDEVYGLIERMCPGGRKIGRHAKTIFNAFYANDMAISFRNLWSKTQHTPWVRSQFF